MLSFCANNAEGNRDRGKLPIFLDGPCSLGRPGFEMESCGVVPVIVRGGVEHHQKIGTANSTIFLSLKTFFVHSLESPAKPRLTCTCLDLFKINGAKHGSVPPLKKNFIRKNLTPVTRFSDILAKIG